jgi:hypothetical protein
MVRPLCGPVQEAYHPPVSQMKIAYADPPYIGQAKKHYGPYAKEVNHAILINHLQEYDGWALSCSSPSLKELLPLCPDNVRICAWVKPFASFKPGVTLAYSWEPILMVPARKRPSDKPTVRDYVSANITLLRGINGAKPETFCFWMFEALGMEHDDNFFDLFPGSEAVTTALRRWRKQISLLDGLHCKLAI